MKSVGRSGRLGLVLTGGGARGAYQAGAIQAVAELAARLGVPCPFPVVVGCSAGAINCSFLAAHADVPFEAPQRLVALWSSLRAEQIYRTDVIALGRIGVRWLAELSLNGLIEEKHANALLDTSPLRDLLEERVPFGRVNEHIRKGKLRGVAVTAVDYCCETSRIFFQGDAEPWVRAHRSGDRAQLSLPLVMASAAIPILFPPIAHGGHYFGDGSMRNYTPLSPAIKLGADRLIVIGVQPEANPARTPGARPTIARIGGSILDAVLLDALDLDLEHLDRINRVVRTAGGETEKSLSTIETCVIRPTQDIGAIATEEVASLPRTLRHLLGGLGSPDEAAELISYLLFEPAFTRRLIDLGYQDAKAKAGELELIFRARD